MCRLCCSRALWTARQGTPLDSASDVRCSAVQSMARGGSYFPNKHTHNTLDKGPTKTGPTIQTPTGKATKTEGGQTQGGRGRNPRGPRALSSTQKVRNKLNTGQETEAPRNGHEGTGTPTKRQGGATNQWKHLGSGAAGTGRGGQQTSKKRGGAEQNTNTGTPTQRKEEGSREAATDRWRRGAQGPEKVYSHALVDGQRGTWNIKDEYLSAAAQGNAKTLQSGVEGVTPHTGQSL